MFENSRGLLIQRLHQQWENTIFHARHPKLYALYVLQIIVWFSSWSYPRILVLSKKSRRNET